MSCTSSGNEGGPGVARPGGSTRALDLGGRACSTRPGGRACAMIEGGASSTGALAAPDAINFLRFRKEILSLLSRCLLSPVA